MGDEKDAFYVVQKGNIVGIYKSISDLQSVLRSSVNDTSISVSKGYGLSEEAEEYLASRGLNNAIYCIGAPNVQDDLFGRLIICPCREPNSSKDKSSAKNHLEKRPQVISDLAYFNWNLGIDQELVGSASFAETPPMKLAKLDNFLQDNAAHCGGLPSGIIHLIHVQSSCIVEFDGASKGNPGQAGAGAVLRTADGSMVFRLREGVGIATNNVAEYRGAILGLRFARQKGFKYIRIQGDSKLVCMQVQGLWKTKTQSMAELCKVAKELKDQFVSFQICHVERDNATGCF
ncbi:hypothetical protein DH2020_012693 [Rehmannia glutinosa]|uniref:RNase H type-1 domain-containing protein n=1 Tax=Rehmannia glutinosa TaxID=99300 RepID=A0ABR0X0U2_REHGL